MSRSPRSSRHPLVTRFRRVEQLGRQLELRGYPRLEMLTIVTLTGGAGFLASYCLLLAGVDAMWLRYPCALAIAYGVFLVLLWLWMRFRNIDGGIDLPGGSGSAKDPCSGVDFAGNGGSFDGGGASANLDWPSASSSGDSGSALPDIDIDVGEAAIVAIPIALVIALGALMLWMGAIAFSVVSSAPLLFAELLVDGILSASLYRRLRGLDRQHWIETALGRTIGPFLVVILLVGAAGAGMSLYAPEARSLGAFIDTVQQVRSQQ